MNLPTNFQVNAATRNIAAGVAMAISAFGLSTKINPETATAIVNAGGTLFGDCVTLAGLIIPLVTAFYAWKSASAKAQAVSITKSEPGTIVVTTAAIAAATPNSPNVVSADTVSVVQK
jgi:hypothetical protein